MFSNFYRGRRVLVTGHTGFKGSWLSLWLRHLGAHVVGFSNSIPTTPSLFELASVADDIDHIVGDVLDRTALNRVVLDAEPDVIFHLAAQSLVRLSYTRPIETLATNTLGTANLLEAARSLQREIAIVVVTSDKCYHNNGWIWGYRETDRIGGRDPYSMSKGAAELVVDSWRSSFFSSEESTVRVATARAGNVIGGGDWGSERLMSDCVTAMVETGVIKVRNPEFTRPWQHVLEPLSGYLSLAAKLAKASDPAAFAEPWNFGPGTSSVRSVRDLVSEFLLQWGEGTWEQAQEAHPPGEAMQLALNCDKAHRLLAWQPVWSFEESIARTVEWYRSWREDCTSLREFTLNQIREYEVEARESQLPWAASTPAPRS